MRNGKRQIIPAGAMVSIESGEYSNFGVLGVFRALVELDADALREEYLAGAPDEREARSFSPDRFIGFLVRKGGLIEEVRCHSWHLGDYGSGDCWFMVGAPDPLMRWDE